MDDGGGGGVCGSLFPPPPSPPLAGGALQQHEQQQQQQGRKRPRVPSGEGAGAQGGPQPQASQQQQQQRTSNGGGRQARMRVVVAAAIVASFVFAGCCVPLAAGAFQALPARTAALRNRQRSPQCPAPASCFSSASASASPLLQRGARGMVMLARAKADAAASKAKGSAASMADIFEGGLPEVPMVPSQAARAAALARTTKRVAGPVDPGDDRETRPSAEGISDEEIEEVTRKWEKRRAARKDRITKQKGLREAELDEAEDVIPLREVPLWYALKVKIGMELVLRDTLNQLAALPEYRGKIVEVLVPMAKSVKSVGKQLKLVEQPLHKGYVFLCMAMDRDLHDAVLAPNGVGCFIGRRVPGKGIIPNPLRAKEADRLKERAIHEASRTIDLQAIPFRPGDRVDVLQGEFAYSRGRVTSVKETELNVAVRRNKVEVRVTLPHTGVRKLSQEELDQEARELAETDLRSYNRARPPGQRIDADAFAAIARSNAIAAGKPAPPAPKKKAPERRGPSLYRVLSDYVNLETFDPKKPPVVEEMVAGMLELTGQREDVGGYYRKKFEMAKKAWEVWKQYLEEKDEKRRQGRERALRRKTMGYDEFNDNWKPPSWTKDQDRGRAREGGGRGWDAYGGGAGEDEEDGGGWGGRGRRQQDYGDDEDGGGRRGGRGGGKGGEDDELEAKFLDQLMTELDGPGAAKAKAARQQLSGSSRGPSAAAATIGDDEIESLMAAPSRPAPGYVSGSASNTRRGDRGGGDRDRRRSSWDENDEGGSGGTLSAAEQKELDAWLGMVTTGKQQAAAQQAQGQGRSVAAAAAAEEAAPVGMGGQPRTVAPGKGRAAEFSLDPAEEQELNAWLARFDSEYAEQEGSDGRRMVAAKAGAGGGSPGNAGPRPSSLDVEDKLLAELLGGVGPSAPSSSASSKASAAKGDDADVDRELAELLAKLEAAEAGDAAGAKGKGAKAATVSASASASVVDDEAGFQEFLSGLGKSGKAADRRRSSGSSSKAPGSDFDTLPSFDGPAKAPKKAAAAAPAAAPAAKKRASWVEDEEDEEADDDDIVPSGRSKARGGAKGGASSLFVRHTEEEGDEDEEDEDDRGASRMMRRNMWADSSRGAGSPSSSLRGGGDGVGGGSSSLADDEDDLHLGAYPLDPEDAPGQFIEEGLEDAVHMGRPRAGAGGLKQGFMFDDPLGGGRGGGGGAGRGLRGLDDDEDELLGALGAGVGGGAARGGRRGKAGGGRGLEALGEDDDIFAGLGDLADLEELEKLDKLFAAEAAATLGSGSKGSGSSKKKRRGGGGSLEDDDWSALAGGGGGAGAEDDVDALLKDLDLDELEAMIGESGGGDDWGLGPSKGGKGKKAASASSKGAKGGGGGGGGGGLSAGAIEGMKVADLKAALKARGLPVTGSKGELQARLRGAGA